MARTVWLASYPKSGNTWFRIFLANLLHPEQAPVDLNNLPERTPIASSRGQFDDLLGVPSALLTQAEIDRLRPAADAELARAWDEPLLVRKAHKGRKGLSRQLRQDLGTWEAHATGWLQAPMDLCLLRYEAMQAAPLGAFRRAVHFLGLAHDA